MNTERFDGHTPGPWILSTEGSATGDAVRWISAGIDEPCVCTDLLGATDADAHLIAAAPDLLAEVKRLRLIVHELLKDADHDTHIWFHSNGWCEDLRQPCTVCDSRSDCDQSLITPQ